MDMDNMEPTITVNPLGTATPVGAPTPQQETMQQTIQQAAEAVQQVMDSFPDDVPPSEEEAQKAQGFLHNFMSYISSAGFHDDIMETSRKHKIPPKKLAQGFFESCLGTIGDILGIGISTAGNVCHTLVDIVANVLHGGINLIVRVANGLASIVTLNRTCVA